MQITYDEAPTVPTLSSPANNYVATGNSITLSAASAGSDPNGATVDDRLVVMEQGGPTYVGPWSTSYSWLFSGLTPGALYYWAVESNDGTIVVVSSNGDFYGPALGGQTAPQQLNPTGGPIGPDGFGGWDPSTQCSCANTTSIQNLPYGVNPENGDLVENSQDISVPGAGMPLGLSRTYDNGLAVSQTSAGTSPGPLGYGWSYNLGMSITTNSPNAAVNQENGSEITFIPYTSSDSWCQAAFNYCPADPRVLATLNHNSNGTWTFQRDDTSQTTFTFSSSGVLTTEQDAAGDMLTSSTEAADTGACPSGAATCTVWTNFQSGRSLTLAFDSNTPARLLSATDGDGDTVSYCYFGQPCANGASGGGAQDLYSATLPGGAKTTYAYDSGDSNTELRHDILSEITPTGGTVSNTYNGSGQVTAQSAPSGDVSLTYNGSNTSSTGGQTYVCDWPSGTTGSCPNSIGSGTTAQETEYQYSGGGLVAETTPEVTSSGSVVPVTQYDNLNQSVLVGYQTQSGNDYVSSDTLMTSGTPEQAADVTLSTDALGNTTEDQYNAYNQVTCEVAPAEYLYSTSLCPPSTTVTTGTTLPQATIAVASSSPFTSLANLVAVSSAGVQNLTCTGSTSTTLTGCSGGTGTLAVGQSVFQAVAAVAAGADPWPGVTVSLYNALDQLVMTTDPLGRTTEYWYTGTGLSVPAGLQYCSVGPVEYQASVTCPGYGASAVRGTTSSTFDAAGDVLTETDPDGDTTTFTYATSSSGLAVSSTSPVVATTYYLGSSPESETSNSFSPPAESVVVVTVFADDSYNAAGWTSESMTDSLSTHLSWHLVKFQGDTSSTGAVGVWWAYVASTPGSMTVTPTLAVGSGQYIDSMGVAVKVFTGANTTAPIGATASGDYSGQDLSVLLTPTTTGSALLLAGTDGHFTGAPSAGSGDYVSDVMNNNNTSAAQEWAGTSSGPTLTASTSSQTLALIGGSSSAQFDYLAFEVVPAGTGTSHPGLPVTTTDPDGVVTTDTYNGAGQVTKSAVSSGSYSATTVTGYDPAGNAYCTIAALAYSQGDTTCPLVSALASGSAGLSLPQSTIYVTSTTGFSVSSPIAVPSNAGLQVVTCTGTTSTPSTGFTGCTGGTGALAAGSSVVQVTSTAAGTDYWPGDKITIADANNRTLFAVSPIGGVTQELYDGTGSEYCSVSAQAYSNGVRCPSTEPTTPPTATSDPYLGATITSYNAAGQVAQVTNPVGGVTLSTYDGDGNLSTQLVESSSSSGAPTVQTNFYYNADDQLVQKIVGYGSSSPLTTLNYYDPDGNVYCSVSAKAYATGAYACPAWQANWETTAANAVPSVSSLYSSDGGALVTTSMYDPDGELVQQSNPDEATTISVYDAGGNVVCAEDAADMAVTLAANPSVSYPYTCPATPRTSPPANGSDPGYETSIYDPYGSGRLTSSTDAAGDTTSYTYDPDGSVLVTTGPGGQVTTNCYYRQTSSCASGAPAGGGAANALYSTTSPAAVGEPSGAVTTYTYLPGGAAHTTTTLSGTGTNAYDAAGDLLSVTYGTPTAGYAAAPNVTYAYFTSGLRHTMVDGTGTTTYAYDNNNDELSAAFSPAGGSGLSAGTTSYSYYTTGQEQTLTYPSTPSGGSPTVTRTYNADGEPASTTDWAGNVVNFTDDPDGNTTGVAYPNSTEVSSTYDYGDAETSVTAATGTPASPGTTLVGANYTLNGAEQVTSETDTGAISTSRAYSYDSADRLGTATLGSGSPVTATYDSSSDPTTLANGTTQTFNSDGQLLTSKPSGGTTTSYNYNATGDRTSSGSGGSPAAISAVGSTAYHDGVGVTTLSVTPATDGDLLALAVTTNSTAGVTSVSGGGVTTWHQGPNVQYGGGGADPDDEVWWGVITTTGASTITISPTPTGHAALMAQEFTAGSGVTWSLATSNTYESTNSPVDYPSLTPTASEELYFGYAVAGYGNISAGTTSGFTYSQDPNSSVSMLTWDPSVSSTVQPTATQNNTGGYDSTGAVFEATTGSGSGSPAAITAVGNLMYNQGSGVSTDSVTAATTGDLMVLAVTTDSTAGVSSVSGGGVTTWHQGPNVQYGGGGADPDDEVWWGVITSTGASTITISPTPTGFSALQAHEYTAGSGVTWSLAASNTYESTNSPVDWPSVTPTASEELYFGYAVAGYGNISAGTTSGFTYSQDPNSSVSMVAWDPSVSSTVQPTGTQNNTGGYDSTGAMFAATTGSGGASNTYSYNEADQMTSATVSPNSVSYAYNGNGLLTGRTTGGVTATLTWDSSSGLPLLLSDGTNEYLYGPNGTPIEQVKISTGTPEYFVSDDQGSTRALIGTSGSVVSTFSFDPDGNVVGTSGTVATPLLYDGQYTEPVTGFYYFRARWYDPATAEFTSVDPDVAQTGQPYVYAGDDAVNEGDPSGLAVQPPFYCLWWEIQCWTTELSFPNEKALQNMYMNTQLGGPWEDEYQVNLPSGWSYPISSRRYDLYNPETHGALELKVGYTTATSSSSGSSILTQIGFDVALLTFKGAGFTLPQTEGGGNAVISGVVFQDYPRTIPGDYGISGSLAWALKAAVDATDGQYSVQIYFPEDWEKYPKNPRYPIEKWPPFPIPVSLSTGEPTYSLAPPVCVLAA